MKGVFTPKQLSRAIDVSESSIKRWCDKGIITTQYTAGGHRRITMASVTEFLRGSKYKLVSPEALGLPPTSGQTERVIRRANEQFTQALLDGDQSLCWQIAFDLYLAEHSFSTICDDVFAESFREIGDRWECGKAEVYQERHGCEILLRVMHNMRSLISDPDPEAPLAIGGTATGDQYSLGTTMAELILRDIGWNAHSLGDNLPFETLAEAIKTQKPSMFWLSCSHIDDEDAFLADYAALYEEFSGDVAIVVGGNALSEELRQRMQFSAYCDSMQHLEGFAQTLLQAAKQKQHSIAPQQDIVTTHQNGVNSTF